MFHGTDDMACIRNYSLIADSPLTRSSSVGSDMSSISTSRRSQRSIRSERSMRSERSQRSQRSERSGSERSQRSRSRSPSVGRSFALLSRGISKLYMSRLLGVLVVITAPLMLDLIQVRDTPHIYLSCLYLLVSTNVLKPQPEFNMVLQCLPLLAAHFFETGHSRLTSLFLPLLLAFLLPRFALLALSSLSR